MAHHYASKTYLYSFFVLLFLILAGCKNEATLGTSLNESILSEPQIEHDLEEIKADGKLSVITIYNSTGYFIYRGKPMGFEYELVERLAKSLDLELEIKVAKDIDQLFNMLNRGEGDLIAYGLSITEARKKVIAFTNPLYLTHQVLVQRKPSNWRKLPGYKVKQQLIEDPVDLIGKKVHVRKNSSYYERLHNLEEEIGGDINIITLPGEKTTDEIIKMVVDDSIDFTISDDNVASINQTYYPILDIETQVSFSQRIAWGVRSNSPSLLKKVNDWVERSKKQDFYYVIYDKYFKNKKSYSRRIKSEFYSKNEGKISEYDSIIKTNAERIGWDWRLLSSLVYQESRFKPTEKSWAGAGGLMQVMPATAKDLGIDDIHNPSENLKAGVLYLEQMRDKFNKVTDSVQKIKFTMAAYNSGLGHVRDAQRLTKAAGENHLVWDDHVEDFMLKLSSREFYTKPQVKYGFVRGREPFLYVKETFLRYDHYRVLIPLHSPETSL
ncbi:MAG: transglycosylase SLT domain-containing protein [Mesonia sp.]|uniref:transglycosylase SLT domain-containing protein n=1 Tax=Mesonia sp. TaxID=1960830 RepID=UPI003F9533B2